MVMYNTDRQHADKQIGTRTWGHIDASSMAAAAAGAGAVLGAPMPEVPREMTRLNESIQYADKSLTELFMRLDGKILRPIEPEPAGGATCAGRETPSTGYGQELNGFAYRVESIASRVQDLLRRLEV